MAANPLVYKGSETPAHGKIGAESDPALRQQPGSWPDSVRESDMTQRTRTTPSVTRRGASPIGELLQRTSVRAMGPVVAYDGPKPERPASVYRLSDRTGRKTSFVYLFCRGEQVLYVGMSVNPGARFERHGQKTLWFDCADRYILLRLDGESELEAVAMARYVEAKAIRALAPGFNIAGVA